MSPFNLPDLPQNRADWSQKGTLMNVICWLVFFKEDKTRPRTKDDRKTELTEKNLLDLCKLSLNMPKDNCQLGKTFWFTYLNIVDVLLVWIDSFLVAIFPTTHHAFYGDGPAIQAVTFPIIDGCQVYPGYTRRQKKFTEEQKMSHLPRTRRISGLHLVLSSDQEWNFLEF